MDDDPKLFKQIERMGVKVKTDGYQEVTLSEELQTRNLIFYQKMVNKVNPDAVKKKFKDRKDKDIDNDGDVDSLMSSYTKDVKLFQRQWVRKFLQEEFEMMIEIIYSLK